MVAGSKNDRNGSEAGLKYPAQIFTEGTLVDEAIRDSMRQVHILHKQMGVPLVGSVNGKLVTFPPEQIEIHPASEQGSANPSGMRNGATP